ncbi:MAG: GTP--adenosylcobinamide-phosphate guanylyltransferase [Methanophagales archaeon ANME-1-THS]|nr:MAG: GTP--adenosylcobinamide-phosphate guanylyltransferase [Methanophagales archaeon ANME-1-THS]
MIAILLAGGKSSRMREQTEENEKALLRIGRSRSQKRLLDLVVESVRASDVEDFFVAITANTPKTETYCRLMSYKTIETPGEGYIEDLQHLLLSYPAFVSVACDLPFVRKEHINAIIAAYHVHRISITGAVPVDMLPKGITPGYTFDYKDKKLVSCGLNVVTRSEDSIPFIFDDPLLAININTAEDLQVARSMIE